MVTIRADQLAEASLDLLRQENELVITRGGQPVARLTPIPATPPAHLIGSLRDRLRIHGDVFSTGVAWNAES